MYYVAVDIGCIECGESSEVLGIFDSKDDAQAICNEWRKIGWRGGEHYYQVFDVPSLNAPVRFDDSVEEND